MYIYIYIYISECYSVCIRTHCVLQHLIKSKLFYCTIPMHV